MKCIFSLVFFLFSNLVFSQIIVLNGRVLSEKKPIASANVVLGSGDSTYGYTFTDNNGKFSIKMPTKIPLPTLTISHLSIEKILFPLTKELLQKNDIIIYANARISKLPEVQVESIRKGFLQNGDTTSFAASQYSDGFENVLEDLLKKIPGIKVAEDGKISFRGKQISRILFEGTDLYKEGYRIVSKNLTNRVVDSVQAIENYNPNSLLKDVASTNETILNIVVKDDLKNRISGNLNLNFGNTYETNFNGFFINKASQLVGLYSGNNIGITETGLIEEDNSKYILANTNSFSLPITGIQFPETFLGFKRSIPNNSHFGNLSYGKKIKDKFILTSNISLERNKQRRSVFANEFFIANPDSLFLISSRHLSSSFDKVYFVGEAKNVLSSKATLINHLNFSYSQEWLSGTMSLPGSIILEKSKLPSFKWFYNTEYTKKINTNAVFLLSGSSQYSSSTQEYLNNDGLRYDSNGSFVSSTLVNNILYKSNSFAGDITARFFLKWRSAKFVLGFSNAFFRTNLSVSTKQFDSISYNNQAFQNIDSYETKIFGQSEFIINKVSFSINGGVSFLKNSILGGQKNTMLNAKLGIKWNPSKKDVLLFFASLQPNVNEVNNYSIAPLVKDFRTIQYNLFNWRNYINTNIGLVYGYNNLFKSLDLSASIMLHNKSLSIVRFFLFSGINSRSFLDFGPPTTFITSNLSVGKYISLVNLYVKAEFQRSSNFYFNAVGSSTLQRFNLNNNSYSAEVRSSFDHIFNFTVKARLGKQNILVGGNNNNSAVRAIELGGKSRFKLANHFQFVFDATQYSISTNSKTIRTKYSIFNCEMKYAKPGKKWQFFSKVINIGNVNSVQNFSFSEIMISSEEANFLGRRFTIGGTYLF